MSGGHTHHDHAGVHGHEHGHHSPRALPATMLSIGLGTRLAYAGGLIAVIWLLILMVLS